MPARRSMFTVAALVILGAACSDGTAPNSAPLTVAVQRDTVITTTLTASSAEWISFTLPLTIHNASGAPQKFNLCGSSIETQVGGTWTSVWIPICFASAAINTIAAGETRTIEVIVTAAVAGNGGPKWENASVNGTYRFAASFSPDVFVGTAPIVASNSFTIVRGM